MSDTKKMKYHITITNNETGETLRDTDFDALIGAVHYSKGETMGLFMTGCNLLSIAETVIGAEEVLKKVHETNPMLHLVKAMAKDAVETVEEENN